MKKIILAVITLLFTNITYAQHRQGSWQDYLSYARASKIALSPDKVYCATGGGIIFYDTRDNSINKLSKTADLSDFEIQTIEWSEENKVLIVAYKLSISPISNASRLPEKISMEFQSSTMKPIWRAALELWF